MTLSGSRYVARVLGRWRLQRVIQGSPGSPKVAPGPPKVAKPGEPGNLGERLAPIVNREGENSDDDG